MDKEKMKRVEMKRVEVVEVEVKVEKMIIIYYNLL